MNKVVGQPRKSSRRATKCFFYHDIWYCVILWLESNTINLLCNYKVSRRPYTNVSNTWLDTVCVYMRPRARARVCVCVFTYACLGTSISRCECDRVANLGAVWSRCRYRITCVPLHGVTSHLVLILCTANHQMTSTCLPEQIMSRLLIKSRQANNRQGQKIYLLLVVAHH